MFDRYGETGYKFVLADAASDQILIGHRTAKGGVIDAPAARPIEAGVDFTLGVSPKGLSVSVTLNGQAVVGFAYNAVVVDGGFGLAAQGGTASFDKVTLKTNDRSSPGAAGAAHRRRRHRRRRSGATSCRPTNWRRWSRRPCAAGRTHGSDLVEPLRSVDVSITDLPGLEIARYQDGGILLDYNAAGHGWFVDRTPGDDREYSDDGVLMVAARGPAADRIDLLSALEHEFGHAAGFGHSATGVMAESLATGVRTTEADGGDAQPARLDGHAAPSAQQGPPRPPSPGRPTTAETWCPRPAGPTRSNFVNHLARSEAQRNPQRSLKLQVELAPKRGASTRSIAPRLEAKQGVHHR